MERVARGRRIPRERLDEVAEHYAQMPGGCSPINALTRAQADALDRLLRAEEIPLPVFVGQRNWHPFLKETLADMAAAGHRRALGIILSSFRSEASWDRYMNDVGEARAAVPGAPANTETPGSVVDRLSILALRIYHYREQLERADVSPDHKSRARERLATCLAQHADLCNSLAQLIDEIFAGRKTLKLYRQLKMYNDPTLNPYLYGRRKAG